MMPPSTGIAVLLLCVALVSASSYYPCTFRSPSSGKFYDFAPLASKNGYQDVDKSGWTLNVCSPLKYANKCGKDAVACAKDAKAADVTHATFSENKDGIVLTYGEGDATKSCENPSLVYTFKCDETHKEPVFKYTSENPACTHNFEVRSLHACPVPKSEIEPINVFLVPHSHDDVGWLITIDEYYDTKVRNILNTVVESLSANPNRRFIYVEQAYFWRWWNDENVTDTARAQFQKIYANGQLEFVIGGWVMQDEACTTYGADINQMTLGHQFILNTFGARPTKGWQIDPFGASSVTPTLNKLSGFDGHLIDRITDKVYYEATKQLEFLWQGSPSLGSDAEIFTHILDLGENSYCDWFAVFDFNKERVEPWNLPIYAALFYTLTAEAILTTLTRNVLAAWGCDFQFQNATVLFDNMDLLVAYLQERSDNTGVNVKYSLLSDFYTAVKATPNITFPVNNGGDFFPLYERLYWTGYYTSRSVLKGIVRQGEAAALASEQLYTFGRLLTKVDPVATYSQLGSLRIANADAQHHDGVTGTSTPPVVKMYENDLINGMSDALQASASFLGSIANGGTTGSPISNDFSAITNILFDQIIPVIYYNPLAWSRNEYVIIPVDAENFIVTTIINGTKTTIPSQVNPNYLSNAQGKYNLFFQVSIPPLGYSTYYVALGSSDAPPSSKTFVQSTDQVIENEFVMLNISGDNNYISSITNKVSGFTIPFGQAILGYTSEKFKSGAYAFTPVGPANPFSSTNPVNTFTSGPLVNEVYMYFPSGNGSFTKQVARVYTSSDVNVGNYVEFTFEIGPLPNQVECITRFSSGIASNSTFYTDDNGFEFQKRVSTYPTTQIGANHLPLVYSSYIKDDRYQLTAIADRTHSCSSLENGELEIMLHRNPNMTDDFGPALTDTDVVYPVLRIIVDTPKNSVPLARKQPYLLNFPLVPFVGTPDATFQSPSSSFLSGALPYNVHLLSFDAMENNSTRTILRFTHLFAVGEDNTYSQPATVDISQLFTNVTISSIVETTLTANREIATGSYQITLTPKQIRTFIVELQQ